MKLYIKSYTPTSIVFAACVLSTGALSSSCYKPFAQLQTWNNAEAQCQALSGHLVKIESSTENEFIKTNFLTSHGLVYWIGMSDQVQYESCHGNNLKAPNLKTKWLTAGLLYRTKLLLNSSTKMLVQL